MIGQPAHVVIKLREDVSRSEISGSHLNDLRMTTYFDPTVLPPLPPIRDEDVAAERAAPRTVLHRYRKIEVDDARSAQALAEEIATDPSVEIAYVEGGPTPPPVTAVDDPRNASQGYQDAAPTGIDARWAWERGITGAGVTFVDLEQGWTLDHEDLAAANISVISGVNQDYHGHGTAVLGEVRGVDNTVGGVGIAPHAHTSVASQWRSGGTYNTAEAIVSVANWVTPGTVLLLEAQTTYSTTDSTRLPVEVEEAVFDAIRYACSKGLVVVEAAGNGSFDLDTFADVNEKFVLDRSSADFRDSGAIVVGAGSSSVPHSRLDFSNFGSRVDSFGWGENIDTSGDGFRGQDVDEYTASFSGTSGASPIVAGAAVLIQSTMRTPMGSELMRDVLTNPGWHTPSANPATDQIGVMPNVRRVVEELRRYRLDVPLQRSLERVLFGLLDDSPGVIIGPNGPRPVDPGWQSLWTNLDVFQRHQAIASLTHKLDQLPRG